MYGSWYIVVGRSVCLSACIGPFVRSEEAEVTSEQAEDSMVELTVSRLSPATNYTLLIYAENSFGRSRAALIVYATTTGTTQVYFSMVSHYG